MGSHGGDEGNRTPDLLNAIQALSQLSYVPKAINSPPTACSIIMADNALVKTAIKKGTSEMIAWNYALCKERISRGPYRSAHRSAVQYGIRQQSHIIVPAKRHPRFRYGSNIIGQHIGHRARKGSGNRLTNKPKKIS